MTEPVEVGIESSVAPSRGRRRASIVQLLFSYAGTGCTIVKGFIFVPLYLKYFGMATYGAWLATGNMLGLLGLIEGGFGMVLAQRFASAAGARDHKRMAVLVGSGGIVLLVPALAVTAAALLASRVGGWVRAPDGSHGALGTAFTLAALAAGLNLLLTNILAVSYGTQRTLGPGVIRLMGSLVDVTMVAIGLFAGLGVVSLGLALAVSAAVSLSVAGVYTIGFWRREGLPRPCFEWAETRDAVRTTVPVFMGKAASVVLGNSESALVAVSVNPTAAALLAITSRVFSMAMSLVNPVAGAIYHGLAHLAGEADRERVRSVVKEIVEISALFTAVSIPLAFALNRGFVGLWVGQDKVADFGLNALLFASSLLTVRMNLVGMILPALGEMRRPAWSTIAEAVVRLPAMFVLVRVLGIKGVPMATLASGALSNYWYLTVLLGENLKMSLKETFGLHGKGFAAILCSSCLAFAAATASRPQQWLQFVLQGTAVGAIIFVTVLAVSPMARQRLSRFFSHKRAVVQ